MNYIDFFCGAGGLSIGLESSGLKLIYATDVKDYACETFKANLSKVSSDKINSKVIQIPIELLNQELINEDIKLGSKTKIHTHELTKRLNQSFIKFDIKELNLKRFNKENLKNIDLIAGGPPCQGFSNAARGKKSFITNNYKDFIDDPRNHLFKYFLNFVKYYKPKIVLIENVKGLQNAEGFLPLMRESLEQIGEGYKTKHVLFDSSNFGIPQQRQRVFVVGVRSDIPEAEDFTNFIVTLEKSLTSNKKITLKEAIDDLPEIQHNPKKLNTKVENEIPIGEKGSFGETISKKAYNYHIPRMSKYVKKINTFGDKLIKPKKLYNHKARFNNEDDLAIYKLIKAGIALKRKENEKAASLVKYNTDKFEEKYFKLNPNKPSRTIVAHLKNDNNAYIHYGKIPRGITPREAARIQSFPDWYEFKGPIGSQYEQIGNAVPPLLGKFFGNIFQSFLNDGLEKTIERANTFI